MARWVNREKTRAVAVPVLPRLLAGCKDEHGAVYVEFLIAFFPLFLLFLAICQLALVTAARLVVSHAAVAAVRSAIVVLEDPGGDYNGAPLGSLSAGTEPSSQTTDAPKPSRGIASLFASLNTTLDGTQHAEGPQQGPRMDPIRHAAQVPLAILAPDSCSLLPSTNHLERSLFLGNTSELPGSLLYTQATAAITVHSSESSNELAAEPLEPTGNVTVRITYLYHCAVPWVRTLMCRTLSSLLNTDPSNSDAPAIERLKTARAPEQLKHWVNDTERFTILVGQASLPNQGTAVPEEASQ